MPFRLDSSRFRKWRRRILLDILVDTANQPSRDQDQKGIKVYHSRDILSHAAPSGLSTWSTTSSCKSGGGDALPQLQQNAKKEVRAPEPINSRIQGGSRCRQISRLIIFQSVDEFEIEMIMTSLPKSANKSNDYTFFVSSLMPAHSKSSSSFDL